MIGLVAVSGFWYVTVRLPAAAAAAQAEALAAEPLLRPASQVIGDEHPGCRPSTRFIVMINGGGAGDGPWVIRRD